MWDSEESSSVGYKMKILMCKSHFSPFFFFLMRIITMMFLSPFSFKTKETSLNYKVQNQRAFVSF